MPTPVEHVADALSLNADAEIYLYKVEPLGGGALFVKNDNEVMWLGNKYEGLPIQFSGEIRSGEPGASPTPRMVIGQEDVDLLQFKGLVWDGALDGAKITRYTVLLDNLLNNRNIKETDTFRVKQVENYSRTNISLLLATFSAAAGQSLPFRTYTTPDFPWVDI